MTATVTTSAAADLKARAAAQDAILRATLATDPLAPLRRAVADARARQLRDA